jgi:hypothetical protein
MLRRTSSVRAPEVRTTGLAGKDVQLMTKNLDLALSAAFGAWHESEHSTKHQV